MIYCDKFVENCHARKFTTRKKNDYVKLQEGAYPRKFVEQVEEAIAAVATDNLRGATKMVRRDKRSGAYLLTMGFDKRNWWFENDYIGRGEVAEFSDAGDALRALQLILRDAKAGKFDRALEALRIQRQEHAERMIEARNVCGFHSLRDRGPQKVLKAPSNELQNAPELG